MGAPQTPKQIEEDDCVPRVAVVEEIRQQPERKLERRRAPSGPRRRGLENELEGERRRPRRKPRKSKDLIEDDVPYACFPLCCLKEYFFPN
ncbi:unnamed protein product [Euphydryas editha]|uniref:Uncharacterized protein n=1 Tax=Euphydryas editha TaxID=104508 RepID=A0AAU9UZM1_EUPED|nr:unnamed protein product [Euphydryas editha]